MGGPSLRAGKETTCRVSEAISGLCRVKSLHVLYDNLKLATDGLQELGRVVVGFLVLGST
jgi:hypothetical protein